MELTTKQGFKQTEVGLIPEDWEVVAFDKIFTYYSTSNYSKAQMSEVDEVGCIHYGLIHAIPNTQYDLNNGIKYYVTSEQAKYEYVRNGDVIMVDASEDLEGINKSVEVFGIGDKKYISGLHTYLLRDKKGLLADKFRGIVLNSQFVKNQMLQLAVGMKVFGVSKTQLAKVKILLPPTLKEQKAIATALSDVDNLITSLEGLIAKKQAIKQGAMQQLLIPPHKGGKRLPGFSGEWEERTIESLVSNNGLVRGPFGGALKKDFFVKNGYKVYEQKNAIYKSIELGNYFIDNQKFKELKRFEIQENDFILSCSGTIGRIYQIPSGFQKGIINQALLIIRIDNLISDYNYFKHQFTSDSIQKNVIDDTQGGAMKNLIGMPDFKKATIPYPPTLKEQKAIAKILSDMDAELEQLETKKAKYQQLKQGMLQELLTGNTRLV
ncbi:Type I restriction enzyme, S subunit [Tenacibaculum maritimum]|uniref:restriction endonuclease subunit S n=1 Tax=Tenacibaculum maritimum TaxID=107401 RepID=UPI0012E64462|nr:restriction endonuclease subunit S [Tenacibaculum maritimum]CAA0219645.1 Type I restriction enzyme, S subunit [Tenacibaculum maritimum]